MPFLENIGATAYERWRYMAESVKGAPKALFGKRGTEDIRVDGYMGPL